MNRIGSHWLFLLAILLTLPILLGTSPATCFDLIQRNGDMLEINTSNHAFEINWLEILENPPEIKVGQRFSTDAEYQAFLSSAGKCRSLLSVKTGFLAGTKRVDLSDLSLSPGKSYWLVGLHKNDRLRTDGFTVIDAVDISGVLLKGRTYRDNSAILVPLWYMGVTLLWFLVVIGAPLLAIILIWRVLVRNQQPDQNANLTPANPARIRSHGPWTVHALNPDCELDRDEQPPRS